MQLLEKTERPITKRQFWTQDRGWRQNNKPNIIQKKIKESNSDPPKKLVNPGSREGKSVPVSYNTTGKYILSDRGNEND